MLNDSQAAQEKGHNAALVGNDKSGWHFFSKNGVINGVEVNVHKQYATKDEFDKDFAVSERFNRSRYVSSNAAVDQSMIEYGEANYNSKYSKYTNNCGDLVDGIIKASESADLDGYNEVEGGYKPGEDGTYFGVTWPNKSFDKFKDAHLSPSERGGPYSGTAHQ